MTNKCPYQMMCYRIHLSPRVGMVVFVLSLLLKTILGASQTLGGIILTQVSPRIVTPNDDAKNDSVYFRFNDTLSGLPLETAVMDVTGAKVASLSLNSTETALIWNGKDDNGRSLPAGIYIYSIKLGNNAVSGTIVVAR